MIATKCDLLAPDELARSLLLIDDDLAALLVQVRSERGAARSRVRFDAPEPSDNRVDTFVPVHTGTAPSTDLIVPKVSAQDESEVPSWQTSSLSVEADPAILDASVEIEMSATTAATDAAADVNVFVDEDAFNEQVHVPLTAQTTPSTEPTEVVSPVDIHVDEVTLSESDSQASSSSSPTSKTPIKLRFVIPISASTGAGIRQLWTFLESVAYRTSISPSSRHDEAEAGPIDGTLHVKHINSMQSSLLGDPIELKAGRSTAGGESTQLREHALAPLLRRSHAQSLAKTR